MSQSLVLNHAARVLDSVSPDLRADAALRQHLSKSTRFLSTEKRDIARAVFTYFRWKSWLDERSPSQSRIAAALELQQRFDQNPASIKDEALAARAVPEWVKQEMDVPAAWLRQLQKEPPLWVRARPGRAAELAAKLGDCKTTPHAPDALLYRGSRDLFTTPEFQAGLFEIQDLASQLVGLAAAPLPGQTWWDCCAGEGGKTLHLADQMQNKGLVWASDRSLRRLDSLKRRFGRAKLFNYRAAPWEGTPRLPTKAKFDGILLDAPCSGLGTWQRNPHARWSATPTDVRELSAIQARVLEIVSGSLKPGGLLVYAVCTLTRAETTEVAGAFSAAHSEFEPLPVLGQTPQLTIWPQDVNANGMFIAIWKRKAV